MSAKAKLIELRELFAATHWTKGTYRGSKGDKAIYCAVGGARHVVGSGTSVQPGAHNPARSLYYDMLYALAVEVAPKIEALIDSSQDPDAVEPLSVYLRSLRERGRDTLLTTLEGLVISYNDMGSTDLAGILAVIDAAAEAVPA